MKAKAWIVDYVREVTAQIKDLALIEYQQPKGAMNESIYYN